MNKKKVFASYEIISIQWYVCAFCRCGWWVRLATIHFWLQRLLGPDPRTRFNSKFSVGHGFTRTETTNRPTVSRYGFSVQHRYKHTNIYIPMYNIEYIIPEPCRIVPPFGLIYRKGKGAQCEIVQCALPNTSFWPDLWPIVLAIRHISPLQGPDFCIVYPDILQSKNSYTHPYVIEIRAGHNMRRQNAIVSHGIRRGRGGETDFIRIGHKYKEHKSATSRKYLNVSRYGIITQ